MENYLITKDTIAILKKDKQTIIYDVENYRVINKNIKTVLNLNCNFYGSTLIGRKKSAENILDIKYKVPIVLDEASDITLLQLSSLRKEETLLLVLNKIVSYQEVLNKLVIKCINNQEFEVNISKNCFEKLLLNSFKLNNVLKWRKSVNSL